MYKRVWLENTVECRISTLLSNGKVLCQYNRVWLSCRKEGKQRTMKNNPILSSRTTMMTEWLPWYSAGEHVCDTWLTVQPSAMAQEAQDWAPSAHESKPDYCTSPELSTRRRACSKANTKTPPPTLNSRGAHWGNSGPAMRSTEAGDSGSRLVVVGIAVSVFLVLPSP